MFSGMNEGVLNPYISFLSAAPSLPAVLSVPGISVTSQHWGQFFCQDERGSWCPLDVPTKAELLNFPPDRLPSPSRPLPGAGYLDVTQPGRRPRYRLACALSPPGGPPLAGTRAGLPPPADLLPFPPGRCFSAMQMPVNTFRFELAPGKRVRSCVCKGEGSEPRGNRE